MARRRTLAPFFDALSDLKIREKIKQQEINKLFEYDKFEGKSIFKAEVISGCDEGHQREDTTDPNNLFFPVVLRVLDIDDSIIPDPRDSSLSSQYGDVLKSCHPIAYSDRPYNKKLGFVPRNGQIVDCYYSDPVNKRGLTYIYPQEDTLETEGFCSQGTSSRDAFQSGGSQILGDTSSAPSPFGGQHAIEKLEARAKTSDTPVSGIGSPLAAQQALTELNFWSGRVEQDISKGDSIENMRIKLYTAYVAYGTTEQNDPKVANAYIKGSSAGGTGGASTGVAHWSATSISYVMRGTGFPKYYGHSFYSSAVANGKAPGWEMYSTSRAKIVVQLGDVFVRTGGHGKGKTRLTAAHGDMVYKITSQGAHLCGGNLGPPGTFKEAGIIPLGPGNVLEKSGRYLIVLKKMR